MGLAYGAGMRRTQARFLIAAGGMIADRMATVCGRFLGWRAPARAGVPGNRPHTVAIRASAASALIHERSIQQSGVLLAALARAGRSAIGPLGEASRSAVVRVGDDGYESFDGNP